MFIYTLYTLTGEMCIRDKLYGLSPYYIRRLCKAGKIRYVNAGRGWLVNLDSLARYFEQDVYKRQVPMFG